MFLTFMRDLIRFMRRPASTARIQRRRETCGTAGGIRAFEGSPEPCVVVVRHVEEADDETIASAGPFEPFFDNRLQFVPPQVAIHERCVHRSGRGRNGCECTRVSNGGSSPRAFIPSTLS